MSISRSDDELPSESQPPRVIPKDDDKGKQSFVEWSVPLASTSALPIGETMHGNMISIPHSNDGLSSELQSSVVIPNDDDKSKQPLVVPLVPQASTSAPPIEERHRKLCRGFYNLLVRHVGDNETMPLQPETVFKMLTKFGMKFDFTNDDLGDMLKLSGYVDEYGEMDFESFVVFTKDFKVFESLRMFHATRYEGHVDRGPLGDFFAILAAGYDEGFTNDDLQGAFRSLDTELTDEGADSLVRYANLHTGVDITFDEFLKVLRREHKEYMLRTDQTIVSRRMKALDLDQRVGRLMAFVSAFTRSGRVMKNAAMRAGSENGIENS